MVNQKIDGISFPMKEPHDFSFLSRFGRVFCVFATNDSGNISFGVSDGTNKYFIKVAGAKTARACVSTQQAVQNLKAAMLFLSGRKGSAYSTIGTLKCMKKAT